MAKIFAHIATLVLTARAATAAVTANRFIAYEDRHAGADAVVKGISKTDAAIGDPFAFIARGAVEMQAATAIALGAKVYSDANGNPTNVGANNPVGRALKAAANPGDMVTIPPEPELTPMSMNTRQAAVIEPILTTQARGYANSEMIGQLLLPVVEIPNRAMRVLKFGKESFRRRDTRRAPGAETMRIEYGYASDPIALKQEALEGLVPDEQSQEAAKVPGIDLGAEAVREVQDVIQLGREIEIADMVRNPATYAPEHVEALAGSAKWTDGTSDPQAVIDRHRETIRRKIGRYPNTLTLGADVFRALRRHPKIKEQFKYTSADSITEKMLAQYLDVEDILVGKAVYLPENAEDSDAATDIWGNDAILSYRPKGTSFRVPSFGYTYRLKGYPLVEAPYYERNRKSWVYPVTEEYRPYVVGSDAGALIRGAV